jgi:hypothetical protein
MFITWNRCIIKIDLMMNLIICISYHKFYVVLSIILIKVKKVWLRTILKCHSCWDRSSTLYMQDSLGWTFFHPLPNTTNVYDTMFYIVYMLSVQHGKHWVKGIKNVCIIWKIKLQHWINQAKNNWKIPITECRRRVVIWEKIHRATFFSLHSGHTETDQSLFHY